MTSSLDEDDAALAVIQTNVASLLAEWQSPGYGRRLPDRAEVVAWHARLYAGCAGPDAAYVGHLRGDATVPDLIDFNVGVGPNLPDGLPEKLGLWAEDVDAAVGELLRVLHRQLTDLDARLPTGARPRRTDDLLAVIELAAVAHGEWVRIHPYANGNGRTARLWVAYVCLRYSVPVFLEVKPRPGGDAYARAAQQSMGRPPDFRSDHAPTIALFARLLVERLEAV